MKSRRSEQVATALLICAMLLVGAVISASSARGDTTLLPSTVEELMAHSDSVLIATVRTLSISSPVTDASDPPLTISTATATVRVDRHFAGRWRGRFLRLRYEVLPTEPREPQPKLRVGDRALFFIADSGTSGLALAHPVHGVVVSQGGKFLLFPAAHYPSPLYPTEAALMGVLARYPTRPPGKSRERSFSIRAAFFPFDPDGGDSRGWLRKKQNRKR